MLVLYGCRHPGLLSPNEFCRFKGTIGWKFQMSMKNAGPGCRADQTSGTGRLTIRGCRSSVAGTPFRQRSIRDSRRSGHGRKTAVPPVERGGKTFQFIIYHCSGQNTRRKKEKDHPRLGMRSFGLPGSRRRISPTAPSGLPGGRTRRKRPGIFRTRFFQPETAPEPKKTRFRG